MIKLLFILLLATSLRFYYLSSVPPGLSWDEAALGYNAYSILKTGRDEYGHFLPLQLKSFGDYKPALYAYLALPSIAIFGLNEFTVRFPAAVIGVLSALLVYLLIIQLFNNKKMALFSCLMLAISPLAIQFTRPAFESSVAFSLNLVGLWLFVKGLVKPKWLILSSVCFGLSLFTYQASRLFVPLFLLGLAWLNRKQLRWVKEAKLAGTVLILCVGLLGLLILKGESARLATLNFFAYTRSQQQLDLISQEDGLNIQSLGFKLLHGEWWSYIRGLAERYLIYFSPKMLFIDGDYNPRQRVPDLGVLPYYDLFLIPVGVVWLLLQRNPSSKTVFLWLLLAPIPAVLSRDLISTLRAFNLTFPFAFFSGVGLYWIFSKRGWLIKVLISLLIIANFLVYLDRYFVHAPKEYSQGWLFGYKQVVEFLKTQDLKSYDQVVFDDHYGQPYIYYLFYSHYPPAKFHSQAILDQPSVDVGTIRKIDNIKFRPIYWPKDRGTKNSLFVGTKESLPAKHILPFSEFKLLKEIKFLDGQTAFRLVQTQ